VALIVAVHGIGQQVRGEHSLHAVWLPALRDGLARAGQELRSDADLVCAFYGDLFRRRGAKAVGERAYDHLDVDPEWELPWLELLWAQAARVERGVLAPAEGKGRTPIVAQGALRALASSRFFASLSERALIADLKQVGRYLRDVDTRERVMERVAAAIGGDTRVVIGHSLGSVVAYEVLASTGGRAGVGHARFAAGNPEPGVRALAAHAARWPGGVAGRRE
jgi:surfactin synthase thioesterase subunit